MKISPGAIDKYIGDADKTCIKVAFRKRQLKNSLFQNNDKCHYFGISAILMLSEKDFLKIFNLSDPSNIFFLINSGGPNSNYFMIPYNSGLKCLPLPPFIG